MRKARGKRRGIPWTKGRAAWNVSQPQPSVSCDYPLSPCQASFPARLSCTLSELDIGSKRDVRLPNILYPLASTYPLASRYPLASTINLRYHALIDLRSKALSNASNYVSVRLRPSTGHGAMIVRRCTSEKLSFVTPSRLSAIRAPPSRIPFPRSSYKKDEDLKFRPSRSDDVLYAVLVEQ